MSPRLFHPRPSSSTSTFAEALELCLLLREKANWPRWFFSLARAGAFLRTTHGSRRSAAHSDRKRPAEAGFFRYICGTGELHEAVNPGEDFGNVHALRVTHT
jgi:hypothetical protein